MKTQSSVGPFIPRSLLLILASCLPVAGACYYLSQIRDVHPAPEAMSAAAVAARLAPVAHVLPPVADTKVAAAYPATSSNN